jgi:hypothetical protein
MTLTSRAGSEPGGRRRSVQTNLPAVTLLPVLLFDGTNIRVGDRFRVAVLQLVAGEPIPVGPRSQTAVSQLAASIPIRGLVPACPE